MSSSLGICGLVDDSSDEYQKHKKVFMFCVDNKVSLPQETAKYFECDKENSLDKDFKYLLEDKLTKDLKEDEHYKEFQDDSSWGYIIDLTKIPKDIHKIKVGMYY